jgi:hypothetical protein
MENYRKAAAINPDSDVSKKYAADAESLNKKKSEIDKFYFQIENLGFTPLLPPGHPALPGFPGLPQ